MMDYIDSVFQDAIGQRTEQTGPVAPGAGAAPVRGGPILLGRAQPVQFFTDQANSDYLRVTETGHSSLGYPSSRFARMYDVAGQEAFGKAALVNPTFGQP